MNVFANKEIVQNYDDYYTTDFGKKVNQVEESLIKSLVQDIPRLPVLELGCGTGHWTKIFLGMGFEVTATDISEPMLTAIRNKQLNAKIKTIDASELPYEDDNIDIVAGIAMLEFVSDQQKVIDEIYRVLKPGGWLILGCLNAESTLAKNSDSDQVFKNAKFLTQARLKKMLGNFSRIKLQNGVHLSEQFEIIDGKPGYEKYAPAFMGVIAQKT